jgi:hypothetical protein
VALLNERYFGARDRVGDVVKSGADLKDIGLTHSCAT